MDADTFTTDDQQRRLEAEATFGLREMAPFFEDESKPQTVLEVGCGTGVLLSRLSKLHPGIAFTGLEPIGPGFAQFAKALNRIEAENSNITFLRDKIEDVQTEQTFDLIFSVNVFEHLDDWRLATDICVSMLAPVGRLVVLCPNYSVPYESHFALPILGTKTLTHRVFEKRITHLEDKLDAKGLWSSLNFITSGQFARHCRAQGHEFSFDTGIMKRMLDRLDTDPEFRKRQSGLAKLAVFGNLLGAGTVLSMVPARFSAYMKAVVIAGAVH